MKKVKIKRTKAENIEIVISLLKDFSPTLEGRNAEAYLNSVEEVKESLESANTLPLYVPNREYMDSQKKLRLKKVKIEKATIKQLYSFAVQTSREIRNQSHYTKLTKQQAIIHSH